MAGLRFGLWGAIHRSARRQPLCYEGELKLAAEPSDEAPRDYGTALGKALFRGQIQDALAVALAGALHGSPDPALHVVLLVKSEMLRSWRWERLCAPLEGDHRWDFLSSEQRVLFSQNLAGIVTRRSYPHLSRRDLRALFVVASPDDPNGRYGLEAFDVGQNVARLRTIFADHQVAFEALGRAPQAVGAPGLDALLQQLAAGSCQGP